MTSVLTNLFLSFEITCFGKCQRPCANKKYREFEPVWTVQSAAIVEPKSDFPVSEK